MTDSGIDPADEVPTPVTVVYPLDPMGPKVGGSVTFIKGFVRHAPRHFQLRFIGVSADGHARPARRWSTQSIDGRAFEFYPAFVEQKEDVRRRVPLSLRFVLALSRETIPHRGGVLVHNRLETALASLTRGHGNVAVVHNDIVAQIGSGPGEVLWSRFPWLYFLLERRAFARLDQVYTVSTNTIDEYARRYPAGRPRIGFIPTWADSARFAPAIEAKRSIRERLRRHGVSADPDAVWILFSGRLQPQKAPLRLLEVFAAVQRVRPGVQLIVAGDGNLRGEVEAHIASLGLSASVHLLGAVEQGLLVEHYQAADVLLLTSDFEGMPMSVLEALACGLPVVTTDVGEVRRVVMPGLTGEVSVDHSVESLARCVLRVVDQPATYTRAHCTEVVRPFVPASVLAPIYARIAEIAREVDGRSVRGAGS